VKRYKQPVRQERAQTNPPSRAPLFCAKSSRASSLVRNKLRFLHHHTNTSNKRVICRSVCIGIYIHSFSSPKKQYTTSHPSALQRRENKVMQKRTHYKDILARPNASLLLLPLLLISVCKKQIDSLEPAAPEPLSLSIPSMQK
jgi:hypothetical protein